MIICPICQAPVMDITDKGPVQNDSPRDFHCPTYVKVCEGRRWCHFQRHGYRFGAAPLGGYTAIVPPFSILWWPDGKLMVKSFKFELPESTTAGTVGAMYETLVKETANTSYQDFLNTLDRFKNLIIFS